MNMKISYGISVNSADIMDLLDNLQELADQGEAMGKQIKKITSTLCKFGQYQNAQETSFPKLDFLEPANAVPYQEKEAYRTEISRSRIIPFPGINNQVTESDHSMIQNSPAAMPIMALPGISLPMNIPDYRFMLQRDGLILLAWDKRLTETGDRYTAYWVTSIGIPRFYASKPLFLKDFFCAHPDHKSYAAEDGIEFYGQEAPEYLVHVAPELMKSNPRHRELRSAHIDKLKHYGSIVNFNYKYLLKTEKKRTMPSKKHETRPNGRVS